MCNVNTTGQACGCEVALTSAKEDPKRKKRIASKTKDTCPGCGLNAWAKAAVVLRCGACGVALEPGEA